jgi:hypothetical protein
MAGFFGGETVALDVPGGLTRVITRETPRLGGFTSIPGGPSTPQAASWRVWSPTRTDLLALPRVGMGAVFAATSRAPITAVIIIFELTGDYHITTDSPPVRSPAALQSCAPTRHWRMPSTRSPSAMKMGCQC